MAESQETPPLLKRFAAGWSWKSLLFAGLVALLLVLSEPAYKLIPKYGPWGFDLQNIWAFQDCARGNSPYSVSGVQCHDFTGRQMLYPPLLYWSFTWLRWVKFDTARWIWAFVIGAVVIATPLVWTRPKELFSRLPERALILVFGVALVTQFPAAFAIERGNNDVVVLLLVSIAVAFAARGKHLVAGALLGLSTALKLYPVFIGIVVVAGMIGAAIRGGRARFLDLARFVAGAAAAGLVSVLFIYPETKHYFTDVLPAFAKHVPAATVYSHSLPGTFGAPAPWLSAAVILAWCIAAFRAFDSATDLVYAGGLAASTYVAATSFDYNLITAYPLLVVLALRAHERVSPRRLFDAGLLALGLVAIVGNRAWFADGAAVHVGLQIAWLAGTALFAIILAARKSPVLLVEMKRDGVRGVDDGDRDGHDEREKDSAHE